VSNNSTLTLSGNVFNGGINKVGGMLRMTSLNIPTLTVSSGVVRILPNGADSAVSRVQALTFSGATFSQLDLSDNDLIYDYSPGGLQNPITFIHNALVSQQLYSFTADHVHTALGYADNTVLGLSSFDGQPIDSTSVLIKYTFAGDTNLDGTVDIRDLFALATHYNSAGNWLWTDGDVNYDGHVNVQDLTLLAINWQAGVGSPLGSILSSLGLPTSIEPEPGVLSLGLLIPMLERRRRRRF
jgi:hypothetical protein